MMQIFKKLENNPMPASNYQVLQAGQGKPVKLWAQGVPVDDAAKKQLLNIAQMPFVFKHIAVMPDVHFGLGSTIGSVIPTLGAIIPAAVGVDIGCGMMAAKTTLTASDLPDNLHGWRSAIERAVPHGLTFKNRDKGSWENPAANVDRQWAALLPEFEVLCEKHPCLKNTNNHKHLGTLGTGNHFIEVCLDESQQVWFMLHSGSRGVGNRIGMHFIELARKDMEKFYIQLPDRDLAYFPEGTEHFDDYVQAVSWAQDFARRNRELMMQNLVAAVQAICPKPFTADVEAVNCHHNYVQREHHFGHNVLVTRKGAVAAWPGQMGIIPGSMGAKSFIVRGKGQAESFCSCSHGAGRAMSRTEAKKRYGVADQIAATEGVECRKDADVIDEIPMAYKDIDAVMAAQTDLVEIVHTLKQVVCVKG
jgi:tRNA-splicing ligase RtcB